MRPAIAIAVSAQPAAIASSALLLQQVEEALNGRSLILQEVHLLWPVVPIRLPTPLPRSRSSGFRQVVKDSFAHVADCGESRFTRSRHPSAFRVV